MKRHRWVYIILITIIVLTAISTALAEDEFDVYFRIPAAGEVYISWTVKGPEGARFNLYRSTNNNEFIRLNKIPLMSMSPPVADSSGKVYGLFKDSGLITGRLYWYRIEMVDPWDNIIKKSKAVRFISNDGRPPEPVKDIKAEPAEKQIRIKWTPLKDPEVTAYRLYRRQYSPSVKGTGAVQKGSLVAELESTTTEYTDRDVQKGIVYYYSVVAVDPYSGEGPVSYTVPAVLKDTKPPEPVRDIWVKAEDDGTVKLGWKQSPSQDVSLYLIYRGINNEKDGALLTKVMKTTAAEQVFVDHLTANSTFEYFYYIKAVDFSGNSSAPSERVKVRLQDHIPPSRPVITGISSKEGAIVITWAPVPEPDVVGYNIYRAIVRGNEHKAVPQRLNKAILKDTNFLDIQINGGTLYRYFITAVDRGGNESKLSTPRTQRAIKAVKVLTPSGVRITSAEKGLPFVQWDPIESSDLKGYFVYRSTTRDRGYVKVSSLLDLTEFVDIHVQGYQRLYYRVRAFYRGGILSEPSEPVLWIKEKGDGTK